MIVSHVETNPPDFSDFAGLHRLLLASFAYIDGRIDPPSSLGSLSQDDLRAKAKCEDLFILRDSGHLTGCLFGAGRPDCYYIGKLAVAASQRGRGLARALIAAAQDRARTLSLPALELQSRVELVENHAAFAQMGFVQTAATAHPGYARPTSFTFRRAV